MAAPAIGNLAPTLSVAQSAAGAPTLIDADVSVSDAEGDYALGTLMVSGVRATDIIGIRDQGAGATNITFDSGTGEVSYGGVVIGVAVGGNGTDLVITFDADATSAAVEALIENLTYASSAPAVGDVELTISLSDAAGNTNAGPFAFNLIIPPPLPAVSLARSTLAFTDVDNDGDQDLVVGAYQQTGLRYFENTGDASAPDWTERTGLDNPFDAVAAYEAAPLFHDLDSDGDADLVLGAADGFIGYFEQTAAGVFTAREDAANPFDGIQAANGYSVVALADITGDGLSDLVVGGLYGTLAYYENVGTAGAPVWVQRTGGANPFDGVTGGAYLGSPALVDLDSDGDFDFLFGTYGGPSEGMQYFENTGGAANPVFTAPTANPFADVYASTPRLTFVDIDGDGDLDSFAGGVFGAAHYRNDTTAGLPVTIQIQSDLPSIAGFTASPVIVSENGGAQSLGVDVTVTDPLGGIANGSLTVTGLLAQDSVSIDGAFNDIGYDSGTGEVTFQGAPIGVAAGGQNGADLVIAFNGAADAAAVEALIEALTFTHSETGPVQSRMLTLLLANSLGEVAGDPDAFVEQSPRIGTVGFIDVDFPAPALGDLDGDGDLDMLVGDANGQVLYFVNIGTPEAANFQQQPGLSDFFGLPFLPAGFASPALGDLDGDGDLDLIVGDDDGVIRTYENLRTGPAGPLFQELTGANDPFAGATTASIGGVTIGDLDGDGLNDVAIGSENGDVRFFRNTGTTTDAAFTELTGVANPFDGITGDGFTAPVLADVDGDGDLDLFLGDYSYGAYYENTGGATAPAFTLAADLVDRGGTGLVQRGTFGDIDADGDLDLIVADSQYVWLFANGGQGVSFELFINLAPEAPVLNLANTSVTFDENDVNDAPALLVLGATFTDPDETLPLSYLMVTGVLPEETVSIRDQGTGAGEIGYDALTGDITYEGALIGSFCGCSGGDVTVMFSAGVSNAAVQALLNNLTYENSSDAPVASHDIYISFVDSYGLPLSAPPVVVFGELGGAGDLFGGVDLGDNATPVTTYVDGDVYPDLVIRAADGTLQVFENTTFGFRQLDPVENPLAGAQLETDGGFFLYDAENDGDLDMVAVVASGILRSYENDNGAFVLNPIGLGSLYEGIDVSGVNNLFRLDNENLVMGGTDGTLRLLQYDSGLSQFVELTGPANPFSAIDVGTNAALTFGDIDQDGDQDLIAGGGDGRLHFYLNDGGAYVEYAGAADPFAAFDFGDNAAPALVDADNDGFVDLLIVGAADGTLRTLANFSVNAIAVTVNVNAEAELANDDAFATTENAPFAGDVTADNGAGVDELGTVITQIDGVVLTLGAPITLASGALLTMNADGTFSYDPNGRFNALAAPGSGAANTTATDSFTYATLTGGEATVTVTVTGVDAGPDTVQGTAGDDILDGGIGGDLIDGGAGADDMTGGTGDDTFIVDDAGDLVREVSGGGSDRVRATVSIVLADFIENLNLEGSDDIDGTGNALANAITGNDGANTLSGGDGRDLLKGGLGDDTLNGDADIDQLLGGDGDDTLNGGDGGDRLEGGSGLDILDGGADNDILEGGADNDLLYGQGGGDQLLGGDGADQLFGGEGNDVLNGGGGADQMEGGLGDDTYFVDDANDLTVESAGQGTDTVRTVVDWILAEDIERLVLEGGGHLDGRGNSTANVITGNSGDNTLFGLGGADTLKGGAGADVLVGGTGSDILQGGDGSDRFALYADSLIASATPDGRFVETDIVTDYNAGQFDFIDLSAIDAVVSATDGGINDAFTLVAAFTNAPGQITLTLNGGNTLLTIDHDGDAKADYRLLINGDIRSDVAAWYL